MSDVQQGQPNARSEWWLGFDNHKDKLECIACGATVRHSKSSVKRHLEWHEALGKALDGH